MGTGGPSTLKSPTRRKLFAHILFCVSIDLSSRLVSKQVFSALQSLTSVFGMGTGGPSALITLTVSNLLRFPLTSSSGDDLVLSVLWRGWVQALPAGAPSGIRAPRCNRIPTGLRASQCKSLFMGKLVWCTFRDSNPGPTD